MDDDALMAKLMAAFDDDAAPDQAGDEPRPSEQPFDTQRFLAGLDAIFDAHAAAKAGPYLEQAMIDALRGTPAVAVINKTDTLKDEADLAARTAKLEALGVFDKVVAISVREDKGCEELFGILAAYGVEGPHYFDDDAYTDMPEKALVSEILREKMLLFLRDEVPHGIAVTVERFKEREDKNIIDIDANIYCERKSHKGMVIGKGGAMLKKIASAARTDCEEFLGCRVNLQCWVKVKADWRDNEFMLNNFGFKQQPNR